MTADERRATVRADVLRELTGGSPGGSDMTRTRRAAPQLRSYCRLSGYLELSGSEVRPWGRICDPMNASTWHPGLFVLEQVTRSARGGRNHEFHFSQINQLNHTEKLIVVRRERQQTMVRFISFAVAAAFLASVDSFAPTPMRPLVSTSTSAGLTNGSSSMTRSPTSLSDMLTQTELPEKIYLPKDKETAKILGGVKIGNRKLTVITGASSGLGLNTAVALSKTGRHFVVMACRDIEKAKRVASENGMPENSYVVMKLELGSLQSVRDFVFNLKAFKSNRPVDNLICNAAVYRPTDPEPAWTDDGFEQSMGINHFGHFLLANLMVNDMSKAKDARMCIVGSITGNTNTVGGGLVYPRADLGDLSGFEQGARNPVAMADGAPFFGAKAYKDAKVCNMMTVSELHRRYHNSTGINFSSMYPGCIAETALFREKRPWFRKVSTSCRSVIPFPHSQSILRTTSGFSVVHEVCHRWICRRGRGRRTFGASSG